MRSRPGFQRRYDEAAAVGCRRASDTPTPRYHPINEQDDDGANDGADQACAFAWAIPAERLAEIGGNKRTDDSQNSGQNETGGLIVSGHDELRNDAGDEANDDCP